MKYVCALGQTSHFNDVNAIDKFYEWNHYTV